MATKIEKKKQLRTLIISAAQIYANELAGKVFLYVYGNEYFEILFKTSCFMHLTGVTSSLSAKQFYHYAKKRTLTVNQFYFTTKQPFTNAKKKLPCLNRLPDLTKNMVCVLKDFCTLTVTYKIGITDLNFTLGLTEHFDMNGNKIDNFLLPMTLRVNDKSIENSGGGEIVDFIFVRDGTVNVYSDLLFKDKTKAIPHSINHLIDAKFYK